VIRAVGFLAAFGVAIWALNGAWIRLQSTWDTPTPGAWAAALGYAGLFLAALLYLGFQQYARDRADGRVRRPIRMYEWLLRSQRGGSKGVGEPGSQD
jgi:hypothetical protein